MVTTNVYSDVTKKIINNLEKASNYGFKFTQRINQNKETGYCILDKQYLINQITKKNVKNEYGKLFTNLNYQNIDIQIFFDEEKLQIKGWKTTDIYNNSVLTEITIKEVNKIINENIFDLKKFN